MTSPIVAALGLEPHPEGGWFGAAWRSPADAETPGGVRPAATCIHYLLHPGERSAWHVVRSDEIWLWHGPGTLVLSLGGDGEEPGDAETFTLGPDVAGGHSAKVVVPAGVWQAAAPASDEPVLVSCVVSPGFSFDDWRLAE